MKKHNLTSLLVFSASLLLGACGNNPATTGSSEATVCEPESEGTSLPAQATKDVTYPTALPEATEDTVAIHFRSEGAAYKDFGLWMWVPGISSINHVFNYQDDFGVTAYYKLSDFPNWKEKTMGFIVVKGTMTDGSAIWGSDWSKDYQNDRFIDFSTVDEVNHVYHVYLLSGNGAIYTSPTLVKKDDISVAKFTKAREISFTTNKKILSYELKENGAVVATKSGLCDTAGTIALDHDGDPTKAYTLTATFAASQKPLAKNVSSNVLYKLTGFDDKYAYSGTDLGAVYSVAATTFKVWSPVSSALTVRVYDKGTPAEASEPSATQAMTKGDKGVWSATINGDLGGKYYTYSVTNATYTNKEIVDPYAKSAGANGVRGMIVDFSKTNPANWDSVVVKPYDRKQLTVWETHVADVTSSATWTGTEANRKKYLGLVESGTSYTSATYAKTVTTGFDHIKELGVNAVQLMPIFDQDNDELNPSFNWGYNPLNYNCLEGVYSSNPKDGYARIKEFKQVVAGFNAAGINIIMDVVYNHVSSATGSNFDVLVPGYFYRYQDNGSYSNGSGCGNDTASEMAMYRKFMIDSTAFWAGEYKLGGFRFDLMGIHDIETMNEVAASLKKVNPTICVYGEPWNMSTTLDDSLKADQANGDQWVGYGGFNDGMRDALIKGGLHASSEQGWVTDHDSTSAKDVETTTYGLKGSTYNNPTLIADPDKTVNYVACHDNYTIRDRIAASGGVSSSGVALAKAGVLANSLVFLSEGTSFMLAGDEFSRTKGGNSNSYNASYQVNELNYELKARFAEYVGYYGQLIKMKQTIDGLHLGKNQVAAMSVTSLANGGIIKQVFKDTANNKEYAAYHCNGTADVTAATIDFTGYTQTLDTLGLTRSGSFSPTRYEVLVGVKDL